MIRREFDSAVRLEALLRAKFRCEACGDKLTLELHHRGYRADRSLFNCQVLCAGCHVKEHKRRRQLKAL
jgi:5-methylcytosine-specific restriction endonuclease McrA